MITISAAPEEWGLDESNLFASGSGLWARADGVSFTCKITTTTTGTFPLIMQVRTRLSKTSTTDNYLPNYEFLLDGVKILPALDTTMPNVPSDAFAGCYLGYLKSSITFSDLTPKILTIKAIKAFAGVGLVDVKDYYTKKEYESATIGLLTKAQSNALLTEAIKAAKEEQRAADVLLASQNYQTIKDLVNNTKML